MKKRLFLVVLLLAIGGCSIKLPHYRDVNVAYTVKKDKKEMLLIKRFMEYWHARIKGDMKKAFSYELPYKKYIDGWEEYRKKVTPLNKNVKIELKSIQYVSPYVAIVTKLVKIKGRRLLQKEKWVYVDNQWYHKYHQNVLPFSNENEAL